MANDNETILSNSMVGFTTKRNASSARKDRSFEQGPISRWKGKEATQSMAPRHLAWLFLRDPEHLKKQEKQVLSLLRKTPNVEMTYELAQRLVKTVKERNAQALSSWLWDCQMSGISDLVTFAQGLEKEGSAFHAALSLPYSNGPVEGKINKLKSIKRSMYGRSGFPLLRQKV